MNYLDKFKKTQGEIGNLIQLRKNSNSYGKSYIITDQNVEIFYKLYAKNIKKEMKKSVNERNHFLVEKPTKLFGPFNIDFDFNWKGKKIVTRIPELTIELIKNCAEVIKDFLITNFELLENGNYDYYILMRKNGYKKNDIWKDGAHIQFPNIVLDYKDQLWIREKVKNSLIDIFNILKTTNSYESIFDKSITKGSTGWMIYGSIKPGLEQYEIVYPNEINDNILNLIKLFSIFNKTNKTVKRNNSSDECSDNNNEINLNDNHHADVVNDVNEKINEDINKINNNEEYDYNIDDVRELVDMLSSDKEWEEWNKLGLLLHNLNLPDNELFVIFDEFSQDNIKKYNKEYTKKTWNNYKKKENGLKFGSLILMAKNEKYRKAKLWLKKYNYIKNKKNKKYDVLEKITNFCQSYDTIKYFNDDVQNELFFKSLSCVGNDSGMAEYLYYLHSDIYRTESCLRGNWYYYVDGKWIIINYPKKMDLYISNVFIQDITNFIKTFTNELDKDIIKHLNKIINNCEKKISRFNVIDDSRKLFEDTEFSKKLDKRIDLLSFNNGVFDLTNNLFRKSVPEDYITQTLGYDYTDKRSERYDEVMNFLQDIQPDPIDRNYLLKFLASCLFGENYDRLFHIFSGITTNGKSKLGQLISETLNKGKNGYVSTLNENFLTGNRPDSHQGSPDIIHLINKRVVLINEPNGNKKINTQFMKTLTGNGEDITGRSLYSNEIISYVPKFKIIMFCNDKPSMDSNEEAVWKRSRCLNFPTTFVENPTESHHKKIDKNLGDRIKYWKNDFMLILLDYYRKYLEEGLVPTTSVLKFTEEYNLESDVYLAYKYERIIEEPGYKLKYSTLRKDFENWYTTYKNIKLPSVYEINNGFVKCFEKDDRFEKNSIGKIRINNKIVKGIKNIRLKNNKNNNIVITASNAAALLKRDNTCDFYITDFNLFNNFVKDDKECYYPFLSRDKYIKNLLLNCNRDSSKIDLDLIKIKSDNESIKWGIRYEPVAIKLYENKNNIKVLREKFKYHSKFKWLGCRVDGVVSNNKLLEIKCPNIRNISNIPPIYYWIQVQLELEIMNMDECNYVEYKFKECDKDEYINIQKEKGIIGELIKDDEYIYIYPIEYNDDIEYMIKNINNLSVNNFKYKKYNMNKLIYWYIDDVISTKIKRNKEWFNKIINILENEKNLICQ
jgi:hypothetical protein